MKRRRRIRLSNRRQRPVISDTLPFEVPACFSNRHFCDLLVRYDVQLRAGVIRWECPDDSVDTFMRLITGVPTTEAVQLESVSIFGKTRHLRRLPLLPHSLITKPLAFEICHKANEARKLSIPHPLNQLAVAEFYNEHASLITYFAGLSPFSIRRPSTVARYSNFKDRLHDRLLDKQFGQVEERGKEYDQIGSFFVYDEYSNVFKFFESRKYHRAEKRFNAMAKIDVGRCFDSIYTHSLPWALHGNRAIKDNLVSSKTTFAGKFDALMQNLNQNETNGIVIGPEFSRVFAELILQSVDVAVANALRSKGLYHRHDYEIFRYVDDFYIFYNKPEDLVTILDYVRYKLSEVKLNVNPDKTKVYDKPIITEITIAKNLIAKLLSDEIRVKVGTTNSDIEASLQPGAEPLVPKAFACDSDSQDLIVAYKTVLKMAGVSYLDVGNYTFALIESAVDRILSAYVKTEASYRSEHELMVALLNVTELAFFVYASAPRVNISIRMTRIVSVVTSSLRRLRVSGEEKHKFFKFVHDNAAHQLKKNQTLDFKEIENLYLLVALAEIGKEYWLEEPALRQHLRIDAGKDGKYICKHELGYFTITVLLFYMRNKKKFDVLRSFVIESAMLKLEARKHYRHKDAELIMLALDLLSCPFVDAHSKGRIAAVYDLSAADVAKIGRLSANWFTSWRGGNIGEELDAKRRREVY